MRSGVLAHGNILPGERDLSQLAGVSRITVRKAMQALEEATGRTAPASLAVLRQKAERFSTVIDPAQIAEVALGCQA